MEKTDKHDDIVRASLELIAEHGFHGVPMSMIAKKAGVGAGTIYRYFKSKDALITELHQELEAKISASLRQGYSEDQPLKERFLYLIRELLRYFIAHPLHFRYMEQYFNSPYGISLHRDRLLGRSGNHDILMDIFAEGIEQQVLKELPKAALFSLAFGPLISLMRDHILGFVNLDENLIKQATEACWDGIRNSANI
ncbi:MAG: TetR family transcriptional regulator [Deltaproteobacteria bacterium HGW-Deltaproteobacteria-2]|jgi:AcrR family transcriptional regulator|nr:MAG: TetR family transcriptional regulator [Deltaproteobacteria bacterium HGW-Deltaproteobacteria-2]